MLSETCICSDYRLEVEAAAIFEDFADLKIKIRFSEGTPNIQARQDIKITDTAPIVRTIDGEVDAGDLVQRRWSWLGQNGEPVYNFRSEGREFTSGRCLIIADGFYEFTDPPDKKKKRKDKWLFTKRDRSWFCIGGPIRMSGRPSPCSLWSQAQTSRPIMIDRLSSSSGGHLQTG